MFTIYQSKIDIKKKNFITAQSIQNTLCDWGDIQMNFQGQKRFWCVVGIPNTERLINISMFIQQTFITLVYSRNVLSTVKTFLSALSKFPDWVYEIWRWPGYYAQNLATFFLMFLVNNLLEQFFLHCRGKLYK